MPVFPDPPTICSNVDHEIDSFEKSIRLDPYGSGMRNCRKIRIESLARRDLKQKQSNLDVKFHRTKRVNRNTKTRRCICFSRSTNNVNHQNR